MKQFFANAVKIGLIFFSVLLTLFLGVMIYSITIKGQPLDLFKITARSANIEVFNVEDLKIDDSNLFNSTYVTLDKIPTHVVNAFISVEDKKFFSHHGINLARMTKAFFNNLSSMSFKEGASTITQQLIKNTHLTSAKNLSRKFNEIALSIKLEQIMSKNQILENYFNVIYFGSGCYGIESASQHYFSKPVQKLSVQEGALLAGIIKSPNRYSPIFHQDRAISRRNLVLQEMKNDGILSGKEFHDLSQTPLQISPPQQKANRLNSYSQSALDEATQILQITPRQIALGNYKIYTYQNLELQQKMENLLNSQSIDSDFAMMDIDPKTGGIKAFIGQSAYKILSHPRQIGSVIKPILVYGPAINENVLSPASLILDEPLTIGTYTPKNVSGKYLGYVSAREALSKSLNIPAVKTASYVGLGKISSYAKKLGLELDDKDMTYSMALGGLTYGYNLKNLSGSYTALANGGNFVRPKFIRYITNANGEVVYKADETAVRVFRDDTAFLVTDMLKTCAKSGTAKKLAGLDFDVASKTGTVGNNNGNLDAYNIAYTTADIASIWFGNMDNTRIKTAGGNQPTAIIKDFFAEIYKTQKPANFEMPNSVEKVQINQFELEHNHILCRAPSFMNKLDTQEELFSRFNLPKEFDPLITRPFQISATAENGKVKISFFALKDAKYHLFKKVDEEISLLKTFENVGATVEMVDTLPTHKKCEYFAVLERCLNGQTATSQSNKVVLFNSNSAVPQKEKWYI